ncbi:hypothetical protein LTR78_001279 [Recurvomyces mirabilis]|uniref:NACHT domain-containing protein n=1 Tax=Recurvomyces mirabilis TaxID=574656 RepID=A0AAE1C5E1_9PEZI|nr:hypothetical protein LTR78_001279 [Recurvomyces mirabilis]KAK5161256.1 hypothetical protein LTS14_001052 [Recurvomyces mirabilis]
MLDPLTSLGLASNIVQLVDFGIRTFCQARELAATGTTQDYEHMEALLQDSNSIFWDLDAATGEKVGNNDPGWEDRLAPLTEGDKVTALARRSKEVAEELSVLLHKLKFEEPNEDAGRPMKRRRTAVKCVVKGLLKKSEVTELRSKLNDLQQQMILRLSAMQWTSSSSLVRDFGFASNVEHDRDTARLAQFEEALPSMLAHVRRGAKNENIGEAVASKLQRLMRQAHTLKACQRVLESLQFSEINNRQEDIVEAHAKTFQWIYEKAGFGYTKWATEKDGIFWITGKPGSGKSTLIKYLMQQPRTTELLQRWAGRDELIVAYHYFWSAGTTLQKSRLGLLRTLLVHMLQQAPEIVLQLLPERFRKDNHYQTEGARLCLFVDGLDEYEGEHVDLIDLLSDLAKSSRIKLCLSSRPWNVFTRAYRNRVDGELAVQELTEQDIQIYVRDKMLANPVFAAMRLRDPVGCVKLMDEIRAKAEGVFLWVHLVVRSLLRGLGNDDDLETLERRLNAYPDDLDGYFQRMFDRVESVYSKQSARLMLAALSAGRGLPRWAPRCIEVETKSPDYALSIDCHGSSCYGYLIFGPECPAIDNANAAHMCSKPWTHQTPFQNECLTRYIDARCADLLEVTRERIFFIHRTARDFLKRRVLPSTLQSRAGTAFDIGMSLARLYLAGIKNLSSIDSSFYIPEQLLDELRSAEELVQPANLGTYAALFDNLEDSAVSKGMVLSLRRPPAVQHLRQTAAPVAPERLTFAKTIETNDLEVLFGMVHEVDSALDD